MADPANSPEGDPANSDTSVVNADGSFTDGWTEQFDEADRPTLERFTKTGFKSLGKSYVDLQRQFRDPDGYVKVPKEDSSDEVKAEFHKRRGVPDKAEDYEYKRSPDLSDKVETSDEKVAAFSQIAKKWNFTNKQFNGAVNDYLQLIAKDIDAFDIAQDEKSGQEREKGVAVLKKHLGNALEERTLRAEALMRKYGDRVVKDAKGDELNVLEQLYKELPDIENSPWIRLLLDNIAEDMSEDRIKGLSAVHTPTPDAIQGKINELKAHEAYMDENHPQHKDIIDQLSVLYQKKSA